MNDTSLDVGEYVERHGRNHYVLNVGIILETKSIDGFYRVKAFKDNQEEFWPASQTHIRY